MKSLVLALAVLITGCGGTIVRDRPITVKVPVAQPCAGKKPQPVVPLNQQIPPQVWKQLDLKQRSAYLGKQAIDLRNYGDELNAATVACKEE